MNIKPMIFNTEMVLALLDGRKVQTRRPMPEWQKPKENVSGENGMEWVSIAIRDPICGFEFYGSTEDECMGKYKYKGWLCPFAAPGDLIYVRETFNIVPRTAYSKSTGVQQLLRPDHNHGTVIYRAGFNRICDDLRWRPSSHMPRWASRLTLKVTGVRVERVQDITDAGAIAEGARWSLKTTTSVDQCLGSPRAAFSNVWIGIYGKKSWYRNDWVWVIDFKVIRQNVDEYLKEQERAA